MQGPRRLGVRGVISRARLAFHPREVVAVDSAIVHGRFLDFRAGLHRWRRNPEACRGRFVRFRHRHEPALLNVIHNGLG